MSWMSCLAIVFASLARLCEVEKMSGLDSRKLECAWMLGFIMRCQVDRMIAWNSVLHILCMDVPGCPLCNVWRCDPLRCETASRWLLRSRKVPEGTVELWETLFQTKFWGPKSQSSIFRQVLTAKSGRLRPRTQRKVVKVCQNQH